jgi:hypothetical protein
MKIIIPNGFNWFWDCYFYYLMHIYISVVERDFSKVLAKFRGGGGGRGGLENVGNWENTSYVTAMQL